MSPESQSRIDALNTICPGWSEASDGGMLCSSHPKGGIIDDAPATGEWFVIFNDERATLEGYDSRDDAIEAFRLASIA